MVEVIIEDGDFLLSVTQRVKSVSQPINGYVPKSLFEVEKYNDGNSVKEVNVALTSIQGLVVDYLTRFMLFDNKEKAFNIPIKGALYLDRIYGDDSEYKKVYSLLDKVKGLDKQSILSACKIVCYDCVYRVGIKSYQPAEKIVFEEVLLDNIPILVNRSLNFLKRIGIVIDSEFTFEGGYTELVSSGDGDYLTKDTLIDLKVSKNEFSSKWSLQLLMYYLLGIHSNNKKFLNINKLCVFNSYKNESYICNIKDISDKSKYKVSCDVLGYKMSKSCYCQDERFNGYEDYSTWHQVNGSNNNAVKQFLTQNFSKTNFKIEDYKDGIFDITIEDYWTYLTTSFDEFRNSVRPIFRNTKFVKLIKHNGYFMFISVSPKGKYNLLHGARLHAIKYSLEYYYDNIESYANAIIMRLAKYWDILRIVSKQIQQLEPTEKYFKDAYAEYVSIKKNNEYSNDKYLSYDEWYEQRRQNYKFSGKIHGCIIDIDWCNHIYINPYDGTVVPYNATSMYDKNVYKNIRSLLVAQRPEMLPAFENLIESNKTNNSTAILNQNKGVINHAFISQDEKISREFIKVYEHDMYRISNKLKPLQSIYDIKLVQIWYDEVLDENIKLLDEKYHHKSKQANKKQNCMGKTREQKNGLKVKKRNNEKSMVHKSSVYEKYIGLTKKMNCGLKATVINYKDCKNLTIQFEDGLIKSGVRSDHFMEGKVKHVSGDTLVKKE